MSVMGQTEEPFMPVGSEDQPDESMRRGRPGRLAPEGSAVITRRITAVALALGVFMALGKLWLYQLTGSVGILSSLVHSALDMVAAASSFIAVRFAARRPTGTYRFGFGKAESFSAVFQVCLVSLAAFHLFGAAGEALLDSGGLASDAPAFAPVYDPSHDHSVHNGAGGGHGHLHAIDGSTTAIVVMGVFSVLTLWLLIAQSWAIRATGSIAVRGDRAHYTADFLGNLFVMLGLAVSTWTQAYWADAAVGMLMAAWLLYTGYRVARLAWAQLMDRELTQDERKLITRRVMSDPQIRAVTDLRTRASGPHLHMQMRLDLDPGLSLSESHDIVVAAEARLMTTFPAADILIHPHPAGCAQMHGNARFNTG
ncbi:cation diffusion facilitator family transporter [uncultured Algimonas sp.]|uniref:cation diffusion facilitator family transporter n=1 Tax=uncultured Algimonas sp. TaxID=1547920 RepID=UPI0026083A4D|nr:cation diffusion facilitator family transporter [uncultured Algimonas sp.]